MGWIYIENGFGLSKLLVTTSSPSTASYDNDNEQNNKFLANQYFTSRAYRKLNISASQSRSRNAFNIGLKSSLVQDPDYYAFVIDNSTAFNVPSTKEFWLRCDLYLPSMGSYDSFFMGSV